MAATVKATTQGSTITIVSTEVVGDKTVKTQVVRTKKKCYSNITGTGTAQIFSIIDHTGATIFTKTFANGTQASVTHDINGEVTFADICTEFNTWNGGAGVAALQDEKVYIAQLTQSSTTAPTYTVLKNTLGLPIVFTRSAAGVYKREAIADVYTVSKASYSCGGGVGGNFITVALNSADLQISTWDASKAGGAGLNDGVMTATPVTIRVQH